MRYITLGGVEYPIHATMNAHSQITKRYNDVVLDAEALAADEADEKQLSPAKAQKLRDRRVKAAVKKYCADIENSLWQIALLINEAVAFEGVMHGIDISDKVPRYPLTAQKVGMIAKANELNADETVQAIADELLECQGSQKNVTAGELKSMAEKMI